MIMNEKFKELALKAANYCGETPVVNVPWIWEQKYFEYIIRDIMTLIAEEGVIFPDDIIKHYEMEVDHNGN
jgi:hypothetical protein